MDRATQAAAVRQVLRQFVRPDDPQEWQIVRLDEGSEAHVFSVQLSGMQPELVVKLYKEEAAPTIALLQNQRVSLSLLHATLHGCVVRGWQIFVATPLYVSSSPLALIMTKVPGTKLIRCLESGGLSTEQLLSMSSALIDAMTKLWSKELSHGDLALHNILCDVRTKSMSFIDAGTRASCSLRAKQWRPGVHDLSHVLYDLGTDVRCATWHPAARFRKQLFVESLLRSFLETVGSVERKKQFLNELADCARLHVEALADNMYPRRLWQSLSRRMFQPAIKWIAIRRIDAIIDRIRIDLDAVAACNGNTIIQR